VRAKVIITSVLVSFLLSCGQANQEPTGSSTSTSSDSNSTRAGNSDITPSPIKSLEPSVSPIESGITIAEAAHLAPSQVQELMSFAQKTEQLQRGRKFKIIVPTYIPSGFQVNKIDLKVDDSPRAWSSYTISYKNPNSGECFSIDGSSGGSGAGDYNIQNIKVFSEALGIVTLSVISFDKVLTSPKITLKNASGSDGPIERNERGYMFGSSGSGGQNCEVLDTQEAVKVLQSLQAISSPRTKAKPLEEIEKDADRLVNKFGFPLSSCGDPPSGSTDHWYPVFIDGTDVDEIRYSYCKDAVSKERSQYGFEKVQVGSFTSYERASEFAKAVGGRVGEPDK